MNKTCKACEGACCKTLMFPLVLFGPEGQALLRTRAIVEQAGNVLIPAHCNHLCPNGQCRDYEHRPNSCKVYKVNGPACEMTRKAMGAVIV